MWMVRDLRFIHYNIYISSNLNQLFRNASLVDNEMSILPYKRMQWYWIITYILTLAKHAYYDRFELVKQRNDLDMD